MSNMSYCRFQNTAPDLRDCYGAMEEWESLGYEELLAFRSLLRLCKEIADDYGDEIELVEGKLKLMRDERDAS